VGRGRARGAGHRIGERRTKNGFGGRAGSGFLSGAPQIALGDATRDALNFLLRR
jgi:hypothetical protein